MCQRYVIPDRLAAEREFMPTTAWWNFGAKFNVSPEQYVPAIRLHEDASEGVMLRWGLIPAWVKTRPTGPAQACVSSSRIEHSKNVSSPWTERRRCILPMAGFYTWRLTAEKYRQPYFVRLTDRAVFGVAGIWDRWVSEDDDVIESCCVICVGPNELMTDLIGPGRSMPAILRRRDYEVWLRGTPSEAHAVLQPYRALWMHAYRVSPRINSRTVDDPALIHAAG